jgi:hypothetical protein
MDLANSFHQVNSFHQGNSSNIDRSLLRRMLLGLLDTNQRLLFLHQASSRSGLSHQLRKSPNRQQ